MKFVRNSLGTKVLLLISSLTIAVFTGLFIANSYWQKVTTWEEIHNSASRASSMLRMSIEEPMSVGDNEGTVKQFETVRDRYDDVMVFMTDYKGEITYSTKEEELRKNLFDICTNKEVCEEVKKALETPMVKGMMTELEGVPAHVEMTTIENEPQCYHCHGKSRDILGAMVFVQDVSHQVDNLRNSQFKSAGFSVGGVAVLLGALILFMKVSVVNRIKTIADATEDVSQGNLDARFDVAGTDELGNLGKYLGEMVGQIKDQLQYNKSVLNGIIVPLFVANREGCFEFVNGPLAEILGVDQSELQGCRVAESVFQDESAAELAKVMKTGESAGGNTRFTREDGREFPLHYEISPLRGAEGNVVGCIGVLIDLTQEEKDRKDIEAQRENLMQVAKEVTDVAMTLKSASEELSVQMNQLTTAVDTTSDQTSRVATAMEEMNATVLEVAQNATRTAEASGRANQVARDGGSVVQNTVGEIHHVAKTTEGLAGALNELSDRAQNIGQVMSVINDIADQTNLLALNAAIEAARAGEAGRGFAVVADEVRKLAEKTMQATKEVEDAISLIQDSTNHAVREMGETKDRVVKTAGMAEEAGSVLEDIVGQSDEIATMVSSIATAAEQQSATSDEINTNVTQINELSQDVSRAIMRANEEIMSVSTTAQELAKLVEKFRQ